MDVKEIIREGIELQRQLFQNEALWDQLSRSITDISDRIRSGHKLLFCGNGGSASLAAHLVTELTVGFKKIRPAIDAEVLGANFSYLTAVSNDMDFNVSFTRALEAKGHPGDILILMTTSGKSENIIKAAGLAKEMQLLSLAFTGAHMETWMESCKYLFQVPSTETPRIQETHLLIGHILCQGIEENLFPD